MRGHSYFTAPRDFAGMYLTRRVLAARETKTPQQGEQGLRFRI
jgi:hypothetical protein